MLTEHIQEFDVFLVGESLKGRGGEGRGGGIDYKLELWRKAFEAYGVSVQIMKM